MTSQATLSPIRAGRITKTYSVENRSYPQLDYYPFAAGNSWKYQGLYRLVDSRLSSPYKSYSKEQESVTGVEPVDESAFKVKIHHQIQEEDGYVSSFDTSYRVDGECLSDPDGQTLYLQMPLTSGRSWQRSVGKNTHEIRIESLSGLEVPAGYFPHVLKVANSVRNGQGQLLSTKTEWYALNVGRIKSHLIYNQPIAAGCIEEIRDLTGFSLNRM